MKITVITQDGKIVATTRGHAGDPGKHKGPAAGLLAGPGQKRHQLEVPEEIAEAVDANSLHKLLFAHLPKH